MVKSFHFKSPCSHLIYYGMTVFLCSYTFVSLSLSLLSVFPLSNLVVMTLDFGVQTTDCFVLLGRLLQWVSGFWISGTFKNHKTLGS